MQEKRPRAKGTDKEEKEWEWTFHFKKHLDIEMDIFHFKICDRTDFNSDKPWVRGEQQILVG